MPDSPSTDRRWDASKRMLEESRRYLAGGVSSNVRMGRQPWPLFFEGGQGCRLTDVDGNSYIDYLLGQGPLLLGHAHPKVGESVKAVLDRGQLYGGQHELEIGLARRICGLIPCADSVRFGSSGSEMVQISLRLARAFTGRSLILKFEGHYHGWFDSALVSVHPSLEMAGNRRSPNAVPGSKGQDPSAIANTRVLPWNDREVLRSFFREYGDHVAAVIMEPAMLNTYAVLPEEGYLEEVRRLCNEHGTVLIFDEVITGFRLGLSGAQGRFDVMPDLALFGKAMASGFPIACLAGRQPLMDLIADGEVVHAGTYNSNLAVMAAAEATTRLLVEGDGLLYESMEQRGEQLIEGIRQAARRRSLPLLVQGLPSAFAVAYTERQEIRDYREFQKHCDQAKYRRLAIALLQQGVHVATRGIWYLSTVHTQEDIEGTIEAVEAALETVEAEREPAAERG